MVPTTATNPLLVGDVVVSVYCQVVAHPGGVPLRTRRLLRVKRDHESRISSSGLLNARFGHSWLGREVASPSSRQWPGHVGLNTKSRHRGDLGFGLGLVESKSAESILIKKLNPSGTVLGSTPHGTDWCIKALHPASPAHLKGGVPDKNNVPTALQAFTTQMVIPTAPSGETLPTTNYDLDVVIYANPVVFGCVRYTNQSYAEVPVTVFTPILNTSLLSGATYNDLLKFFTDNVEGYRLVNGSATAHMDATSITDSGTVCGVSYLNTPMPGVYTRENAAVWPSNWAVIGSRHRTTTEWADAPRPWETLISMPGAYVAEAREGIYAPLRLDRKFDFKLTNAKSLHFNNRHAEWLHTPSQVREPFPATHQVSFPFGLPSSSWPGWAGEGECPNVDVIAEVPCATRNVCHLAFRNLTAGAKFSLTVRQTYELMVSPGTTYAPSLTSPPDLDDMALKSYFAITKKMAFAYPGDHNSLGDILKKVWAVAKQVVPQIIPLAGPVIGTVEAVAEGFRRARKQPAREPPRPLQRRRPARTAPTVTVAPAPRALTGAGRKPVLSIIRRQKP